MTDVFIMSYQIDTLLDRAYERLKEVKTGQKSAVVPPQIEISNKKTYIKNIDQLCASINRSVSDVMNYINEEMSVETSICNDGLKINGVYKVLQVKTVLSEYIKKFVVCSSCKSKATTIEVRNRQKFLICKQCKCEICL